MTTTTETQNTEIDTAYFEDIEDHILMLTMALDWSEDDSRFAEDLRDRIAHLEDRQAAGDLWIDNDVSSSRDAWKACKTYTEAEAIAAQQEWGA